MSTNTSPIEVFLQPPSPTLTPYTLPPVSTLLPSNAQHDKSVESGAVLPSIQLPTRWGRKFLDALEPRPTLTISTSSLSPCSSPGLSPLSDFSPLDPYDSYRRVRSLSNASNTPLTPYMDDRCLSEPPSFALPSLLSPSPSPIGSPKQAVPSIDTANETSPSHLVTTPLVSAAVPLAPSSFPFMHAKRKRGRPPNSRTQRDSSGWTFVTPTVWNVKQTPTSSMTTSTSSTFTWSATDSTEMNNKPSDGAIHTTFTTTAMDIALSIPRKKRGRKPKVQLAGNSCFVWKDLTARRRSKKKQPPVDNGTSKDHAENSAC